MVGDMREEDGYILVTGEADIEHTLEVVGKAADYTREYGRTLPTYLYVHAVKDARGDVVDYDEIWVSTTRSFVPYLDDQVEHIY
jgi:hypothetical protein